MILNYLINSASSERISPKVSLSLKRLDMALMTVGVDFFSVKCRIVCFVGSRSMNAYQLSEFTLLTKLCMSLTAAFAIFSTVISPLYFVPSSL